MTNRQVAIAKHRHFLNPNLVRRQSREDLKARFLRKIWRRETSDLENHKARGAPLWKELSLSLSLSLSASKGSRIIKLGAGTAQGCERTKKGVSGKTVPDQARFPRRKALSLFDAGGARQAPQAPLRLRPPLQKMEVGIRACVSRIGAPASHPRPLREK